MAGNTWFSGGLCSVLVALQSYHLYIFSIDELGYASADRAVVCSWTCIRVIDCMFVLRFYGPVNPLGSCRAQSVYLTTRLLGRLSPLSG